MPRDTEKWKQLSAEKIKNLQEQMKFVTSLKHQWFYSHEYQQVLEMEKRQNKKNNKLQLFKMSLNTLFKKKID